jgi:hypothetical protein
VPRIKKWGEFISFAQKASVLSTEMMVFVDNFKKDVGMSVENEKAYI